MTLQQQIIAVHALPPRKVQWFYFLTVRDKNQLQPPVVMLWYSACFVKYDRECLLPINIIAENGTDGLLAGRGRTLGSCFCPFTIVCLDMRSARKHVERSQCARKERFASSFASAKSQSPKHLLTCCPLNTDFPQLNLLKHYKFSYSFLYGTIALLNSTDQVRKIRSSLSTLLFLCMAINHEWLQVASVRM